MQRTNHSFLISTIATALAFACANEPPTARTQNAQGAEIKSDRAGVDVTDPTASPNDAILEDTCVPQDDGTTVCEQNEGHWTCTTTFDAASDLLEARCTTNNSDASIDCTRDTPETIVCDYAVEDMDPCRERYLISEGHCVLSSTCGLVFDDAGELVSTTCDSMDDTDDTDDIDDTTNPTLCPDPADPNVHYLYGPSSEIEGCLVVLFECNDDQDLFNNECGCGCITHP
ncbi:MAG: hypothetical protein H6729_14280 [Deltaproteobacteria bacterium]|nr:hypothetical protein [Deltaproteobacteria bacterium]